MILGFSVEGSSGRFHAEANGVNSHLLVRRVSLLSSRKLPWKRANGNYIFSRLCLHLGKVSFCSCDLFRWFEFKVICCISMRPLSFSGCNKPLSK